MYELPYGNTQQLNLDWFIKRWQEFYNQWQETEAGIDHALDAEVQRVEDAMTDLYAARDAAAASATAAAASATSASNDATIAANAATAAAASATLANTKATAAGLSEAAAALSASQAANDATAAATSASQASASASSATDSAQAAAASATAADSSATAAAASAASLVVDSAMSDSSTNPVQNKVINGELTELKTALTVLEPTATSADVGKALIAKTVADGKVTEYEFGETGGGASAIVNSVESVAIASFDDGTANTVLQLVVDIEPVQSGAGDPTPDNVRPITGWTGANVNVSKKNLFDKTKIDNNKWLNTNTGAVETVQGYAISDLIPVKKGITYVYNNAGSSRRWLYDLNNNPLLNVITPTFTPTQDGYYRFTIAVTSVDIDTIMLVIGNSIGDYEPYNGATYPITFPVEAGTVYGGTLTNLGTDAWKLKVDHAIVDLGSLTWRYNYGSLLGFDSTGIASVVAGGNNAICSCYRNLNDIMISENISNNDAFFRINKSASDTIESGTFSIGEVFIKDTNYTSVEDFVSAMTGQKLVYELATPVEYTFTASEVIRLLSGYNNVWADTGDINLLQYYADSKTYIDEQNTIVKALIAPVLDSMVADTALTANDFRIVNNTLYKVTTSIASGATLTVGTNVVATTLAEVIKPLLS